MDKTEYVVKYDTFCGVPYEEWFSSAEKALQYYSRLRNAVSYRSISAVNGTGSCTLQSEKH